MKVYEALRAINLYPISRLTAENIAEEAGLVGVEELTLETRNSRKYKHAQALVYIYLAEAPAVTEAGTTYSFTEAERERFRARANKLLEEAGLEEAVDDYVGWIGEDL